MPYSIRNLKFKNFECTFQVRNFRMEFFTEGFCALKDYKSASKKLKSDSSLSGDTVGQFIQYVKEKRNKRKSCGLSFDVSSSFEISFDSF